MRIVAVGIKDLLEIERAVANLTYKLFDELHGAQTAIKQLDLIFSPDEGEKKCFRPTIVGKDVDYNSIFAATGARLKLPDGMSEEDMGNLIQYRIVQILIPQGWQWTEFVPDEDGGLTTFDR